MDEIWSSYDTHNWRITTCSHYHKDRIWCPAGFITVDAKWGGQFLPPSVSLLTHVGPQQQLLKCWYWSYEEWSRWLYCWSGQFWVFTICMVNRWFYQIRYCYAFVHRIIKECVKRYHIWWSFFIRQHVLPTTQCPKLHERYQPYF